MQKTVPQKLLAGLPQLTSGSIFQCAFEPKLLIDWVLFDVLGRIQLHLLHIWAHIIVLVSGAVNRDHQIFGVFAVKLCSKSFNNLVNPVFEPDSTLLRSISYCALYVLSESLLSLTKLADGETLSIWMNQIKDSELFKQDARVPLLKHDGSEYLVQEVEILLQLLRYTISPFFHNFGAPIFEYPPSLELFEERERANPLELVALSEPVS